MVRWRNLSDRRARRLAARAQRGNRWTRAVLFGAMRRVIAEAWWNLHQVGDGHRADVEQVGAVALLEAIDTFDPAGVAEFGSYAYVRVRSAMLAYLLREELGGLRLGSAAECAYWWIKRRRRQLLKTLGSTPTAFDILDGERVPGSLARYSRATRVRIVSLVCRVLEGATVELDRAPAGVDGDTYEEITSDDEALAEQVEQQVLAEERATAVTRAIASLPVQQARAVQAALAAGGEWASNNKGANSGAQGTAAARLGMDRRALSARYHAGLRNLRTREVLREYL